MLLREFLQNKKEELKESMNDVSIDFAFDYDCNEDGYITDYFNEFADSQIDIYYNDLFEWAKNNYNYIEDAVSEFGIDSKNFSFTNLIQQGQYLYYTELLYEDEDKIKQLILIIKMLSLEEDVINQDLETSKIEELEQVIYFLNVEDFYEYEDIINEFLGIEE